MWSVSFINNSTKEATLQCKGVTSLIKIRGKGYSNIRQVINAVSAPIDRVCKVYNDADLLLNGQTTVTVVPPAKETQYKIYITDKRKCNVFVTVNMFKSRVMNKYFQKQGRNKPSPEESNEKMP